MINAELQELYALLMNTLDGYNRTHKTQVQFIDFYASTPDGQVDGSVVVAEYVENIIDYHYRDLRDEDFDWYGPEDWEYLDRSRIVDQILAERRKEAQRYHREGRDLSTLWYVRHKDDEPSWDVYHAGGRCRNAR